MLSDIWEKSVVETLDKDPNVYSWAKNDHLGYAVLYVYQGVPRNFIPDFLVRLTSGKTLILEVKGQDTERDKAKRAALALWVKAVNAKGGFGEWSSAVCLNPKQLTATLAENNSLSRASG